MTLLVTKLDIKAIMHSKIQFFTTKQFQDSRNNIFMFFLNIYIVIYILLLLFSNSKTDINRIV